MDIDDSYAWKLCRRRLPLDDAFFEDGNLALNAAQTQFISLDTWSDDESDRSQQIFIILESLLA